LKDDGCRDALLPKIESLGQKATPVADALAAEFDLELKHGQVQKSLVRALGKIGPPSKAAIPGLRKFVASFPPNYSSDVEEEAVRTLGRIGPAARDALPEVVAKLTKYSSDNGKASLLRKALDRICDTQYEVLVPHLESALLSVKPDPDDQFFNQGARRDRVCVFIGQCGPALKALETPLRKILAEPLTKNAAAAYPDKVAAAEALWRVTGRTEEALSALESEMKRPVSSWPTHGITAVGRAALVLGRIGEPAKRFLPVIEGLLKSPRNQHDRVALAEAVWRLGAKPDALLAAAKDRLVEQSGYMGLDSDKVAVIELLAELGPAAKEAVPTLLKLANDEADADAKKTFRATIQRNDEEDPDPNTDRQFRNAVKSALEKIDPASLKELKTTLEKK
jgi:hypothetical protein